MSATSMLVIDVGDLQHPVCVGELFELNWLYIVKITNILILRSRFSHQHNVVTNINIFNEIIASRTNSPVKDSVDSRWKGDRRPSENDLCLETSKLSVRSSLRKKPRTSKMFFLNYFALSTFKDKDLAKP